MKPIESLSNCCILVEHRRCLQRLRKIHPHLISQKNRRDHKESSSSSKSYQGQPSCQTSDVIPRPSGKLRPSSTRRASYYTSVVWEGRLTCEMKSQIQYTHLLCLLARPLRHFQSGHAPHLGTCCLTAPFPTLEQR